MRHSICLTMVVKNEASNLADALRSARPFVDDMLVVDTGSEDETPDIARKLGARLVSYPWRDDFSDARNAALKCSSADWVLMMDADERFLSRAARLLPRALERPDVIGYGLDIENCKQDGTVIGRMMSTPRLYRRLPELRFVGRVHEELFFNGVRGGSMNSFTLLPNGPHLRHFGYDVEVIVARDKDARNMRLLRMQLADNPLSQKTRYLITRQHVAAGRLDEASIWMDRTLNLDPSMQELAPLEQEWLTALPAWLAAPTGAQELRV